MVERLARTDDERENAVQIAKQITRRDPQRSISRGPLPVPGRNSNIPNPSPSKRRLLRHLPRLHDLRRAIRCASRGSRRSPGPSPRRCRPAPPPTAGATPRAFRAPRRSPRPCTDRAAWSVSRARAMIGRSGKSLRDAAAPAAGSAPDRPSSAPAHRRSPSSSFSTMLRRAPRRRTAPHSRLARRQHRVDVMLDRQIGLVVRRQHVGDHLPDPAEAEDHRLAGRRPDIDEARLPRDRRAAPPPARARPATASRSARARSPPARNWPRRAGSRPPRSPRRAGSGWFPTGWPSSARSPPPPRAAIRSTHSNDPVTTALASSTRPSAASRAGQLSISDPRSRLIPTVIRNTPSARPAKRRGDLFDLAAIFGLGDQNARDQCAEDRRQADRAGRQAGEDHGQQADRQEQFGALGPRRLREQGRQKRPARRPASPRSPARPARSRSATPPGSARAAQAGEQEQQGHQRQILEQQHREGRPARPGWWFRRAGCTKAVEDMASASPSTIAAGRLLPIRISAPPISNAPKPSSAAPIPNTWRRIVTNRLKLSSSPIANSSRMIPNSANGAIAAGSVMVTASSHGYCPTNRAQARTARPVSRPG